MTKQTISINLTVKQAKLLSSILVTLNGRLQYRAISGAKHLSKSWRQGMAIEKKVANALGMEAFSQITSESIDLTWAHPSQEEKNQIISKFFQNALDDIE